MRLQKKIGRRLEPGHAAGESTGLNRGDRRMKATSPEEAEAKYHAMRGGQRPIPVQSSDQTRWLREIHERLWWTNLWLFVVAIPMLAVLGLLVTLVAMIGLGAGVDAVVPGRF